ncbi:hypothetical protein BS50DRAFT_577604 [Corynespora cassiicola Philippines]|uniref:Uncharacterized protein n=1 Tax=Corynespora cassiicola Philippines TaxID=1448308 RepID=A0A2T2NB97_CORCC|nr:hypothetical protein BS50DRAFT_577604 [Corynespora cassiicola Philippines]
MPDKSGWRKKMTGKAKASGPKNRSAGWKKTLQGNQPEPPPTPAVPVFPALVVNEEADETRSEHDSEPTVSPQRKSGARPVLTRFLSDYRNFKDSSKEAEFTEWWSEDAPPLSAPFIDPLIALQFIHSHMINIPTLPVPIQHNNALLRIFEDYRKVRSEKERLDELLQQAHRGIKNAEVYLSDTESRYHAEIRRLELIIARGTTGMSGLMQARQGSVVDRKRRPRAPLETEYELLSYEELDEHIMAQSQKVLLQRPSSPSTRMATLSKHFSVTSERSELPVGPPPTEDRRAALTRKVRSELDLANLNHDAGSDSATPSVYSEFSQRGDPLPDEEVHSNVIQNNAVQSEAFVALRELGAMVARRRGLNVKDFVKSLMSLFSTTDEDKAHDDKVETVGSNEQVAHDPPESTKDMDEWTPGRRLRHFRSQPQLESDHRRRRHFSFEPGDDLLTTLEERLRLSGLDTPDSGTDSSDSESSPSFAAVDQIVDPFSCHGASQLQTLPAVIPKPSKIPSPVSTLGRVRRETSASSLQTVIGRGYPNDRRDSRSSILTAFRKNSHGSMRPDTKRSASTSTANLHPAEEQNQVDMVRARNSGMAVAADHTDNSSTLTSDAPAADGEGRHEAGLSRSQSGDLSGQVSRENANPKDRS